MRYLCASATIFNKKCNLRSNDGSLLCIRTPWDKAKEGEPFSLYFELDAEVQPTCQGLVFVPEDDAFYAPHPSTILYDFENFEDAVNFASEKAGLADNVRQGIEAQKKLTHFVEDMQERRAKLSESVYQGIVAQKELTNLVGDTQNQGAEDIREKKPKTGPRM